MFFDGSKQTSEIWYYEIPLPKGRKTFTKTKPLQFSDFADCLAWWNNRKENSSAWVVSVEKVMKFDEEGNLSLVDLDVPNPNTPRPEHIAPEKLVESILEK